MTEWRPVAGWEGLYEVNQYGLVCSLRTGRILSHTARQYLLVTLHEAATGRHKVAQVHQLVAHAFLGPQPAGYHVNHKDGDRWNPRLENLEYVTARQNTEHARANGLTSQGERHVASRFTDADVALIRDSHLSNRDLAAQFGVNASTISRVRSGNTHKRGAGRIKL